MPELNLGMEITIRQEELCRLVDRYRDFSHPEVLRKSQALDRLIVSWHVENGCEVDDLDPEEIG